MLTCQQHIVQFIHSKIYWRNSISHYPNTHHPIPPNASKALPHHSSLITHHFKDSLYATFRGNPKHQAPNSKHRLFFVCNFEHWNFEFVCNLEFPPKGVWGINSDV